MKIILASSSPRRRELLSKYGYEFEVIVSDIDESMDEKLSAVENVKMVGLKKALEVAKYHFDEIVIGCDTIVVLDDVIYGKPKDDEDAYKMLKTLSANKHQVISGVGIIYQNKIINFTCQSDVYFHVTSDEEIKEYIATREPFGKAGSYAIQGLGKRLVAKYDGDLENIIGLPMSLVKEELDKIIG